MSRFFFFFREGRGGGGVGAGPRLSAAYLTYSFFSGGGKKINGEIGEILIRMGHGIKSNF